MAFDPYRTQNSGRIIGRWKATGDPLRKPTMYDISKETERQQVARRIEANVFDILLMCAEEETETVK